ncbi:SERTA domain-containing protein 3 [Sinocyclocheilus grahami]|uniref:SERTA domain-containing protein n=1 Tax=Sinocyclocheilus grahami TaxID=75366 RepID=A0A672SUW3_SINGR|nr:PREDICTED: SERTA domain-containing protein 3 [Sinocyclocheilus grahami]XP_016117319.1 PREDICTED: SERTA domain-containing protein 3 [Sinocyclocheilus grahami]
MVAQGQKRKLHKEDERGGSAWESQLQSVLDISMDKFHRDQALMEPCLLRSVLINNTLRQVQSEVRTQVESLSAVKSPTKLKPEPDFTQLSPPAEHNAPLLSPNAENIEDTFMAWTSEEDFSLSSAISGILKDLDAVIDAGQGPCASQRAPLSSVENLTPCPLRTERTSDMASSVKTELMCPQDVALDKLLLDIDTAVFEPEVNLLQGFSVTTEDLVKYLPSLSKSPSASSSSSLVSHCQATWEIQEIEHVMDILMRTYPQS